MKPNHIPGMKLKGIGRRSPIPFRKSQQKKWQESAAREAKILKEQARKESRGLNEPNPRTS